MLYLCIILKVLSYWNLNTKEEPKENKFIELKVLSYWNLNVFVGDLTEFATFS